jgi:hypothetical protein
MLKSSLACAVIVVLTACGKDPDAAAQSSGGLGTGKDGDTESSAAPAQANCEPNKETSCFCTDGKKSGKQVCSASGVLQLCECPPVKPPTQMTVGGPLCADLADQTDCVARPYLSKELQTSMLFVLDRSRSMVCNLPPIQDSAACELDPAPVDSTKPTKWNVVREALSNTFESLPGGSSLLGLTYFSTNGACGVDSTPAVMVDPLDDAQRTTLTDSLNNTIPDGQTPIVGATILAYNHLHEEKKAPGNRYVVLLTDGAESCDPDKIDQLLDVEVKKARDANIRTFVIGAPGSESARALLSELAFRGGTASSPSCKHDIGGDPMAGDCHLDMTKSTDFAAALASALGTVSTAVQDCSYAVPPNPNGDAGDVNVQYISGSGGAPTCFQADDRDCETQANGWQFARDASGAEDTSKVILCGDACQTIKKDPKAQVDILVGCAPVTVI